MKFLIKFIAVTIFFMPISTFASRRQLAKSGEEIIIALPNLEPAVSNNPT